MEVKISLSIVVLRGLCKGKKRSHYELQWKTLKSEFQVLYFLSVHFSLPLFPCYSSTCAVLKVPQIPIEGKTSVENGKSFEI